MPEAIANMCRHVEALPGSVHEPQAKGLSSIVTLLRALKKHDFGGYKSATLERRVARRMSLHQMHSVADYLTFLQANPAEVDQLVKDLLITVTSFFRDHAAFDELSTAVLAALAREKDLDTPIRVWVAGCATGEEAYSIAIALTEQLERAQSRRQFHIFATDVSDDALQVARTGVYSETIAKNVAPSRLRRFFTRENHGYKVVKSIRESVTFAKQNVISDPPFSKLDLVSCRNLLIYLEPDLQRSVVSVFHFALKPGGHLFLGSAENIGHLEELFAPASSRWRIYTRVGGAVPAARPVLSHLVRGTATVRPAMAPIPPAPFFTATAERQLLEHFAAAAAIVSRSGQILHAFGGVERYLHVSSGVPTHDIVSLARGSLKPTLRSALDAAGNGHRDVVVDVPAHGRHGPRTRLRIFVTPVHAIRPISGALLVIFERQPSTGGPALDVKGTQRSLVRTLERDLKTAKREQQRLMRQLETRNGELKAANEELQSTNEELLSSKEELQSMNEELNTVNTQLKGKVDELSTTNNDLSHLLAATDIAMVFVDADLHVSRFTPAASRLLNLIPADVGRPIAHMAHNLIALDLTHAVDSVRRSGSGIEMKAKSKDGRHYVVRILPYRREEKAALGVVVTFVDVTSLTMTARAPAGLGA